MGARLTFLYTCLALLTSVVVARPRKVPKNVVNFKTEPTFDLVKFDVQIFPDDPSSLAPGYIFLANEKGPQIYNVFGDLVWYLHGGARHKHQDFHPCDYLGEQSNHLCWHVTTLLEAHENTANDSKNVIYDNRYTHVGHNYSKGIEGVSPNLHAFHMLPGGRSFLQPVYVTRDRDLRVYMGEKNGAIWDSCFQEIDVATGNEIFRWCATDHFHLWETSVYFTLDKDQPPPGQENATSRKAGRGTSSSPFDFFHINAITKNSENDYLISSRHFDQILKVAGPDNAHGLEPGTTIWRLGGYGNNFDMEDFSFHKQHAARYISTGTAETVLSLFNNEWEGSTLSPYRDFSSGQIISLNNATMEAVLLNEYIHPFKDLSGSQGNMQLLPNGNAFLGWGRLPQFSEFSHGGTCLYHVSIETHEYNPNSYRAYKGLWKGNPTTAPKLLAYAKDCSRSSPLVAYVSWNGATEVRSWRFYVATQMKGPWLPAGEATKTGFETKHILSSRKWLSPFMPYVSVQAVDSQGAVLGRTTTDTWVPSQKQKSHCNRKGCFHGRRFEYKPKLNHAHMCKKRDLPAIIALAILVIFVEGLNYAGQTTMIWVLEKLRLRGDVRNVDDSIQVPPMQKDSTKERLMEGGQS